MINGEKDQLGNAAILNICKRNITCHAALILRGFFFQKPGILLHFQTYISCSYQRLFMNRLKAK